MYHNMSGVKTQKLKEYQNIIGKLKRLNLVINIFYGFNNVCTIKSITFVYFKLTLIKA